MSTSAGLFREHCERSIREFVQTAVIIDNEAYVSSGEQEKPRRATRAPASILEAATVAPEQHAKAAPPLAQDSENLAGRPEERSSPHALNAKALTDAFHRIEVVCGLYKPSPTEQPAELATKAARHADVVILDWYLEDDRSSTKAKEVIRSILRQDLRENGRLRLIAVYTSATDLPGLAREVFEDLQSDIDLKDRFDSTTGSTALIRGDAKICFLNKPTAPRALASEVVAENELPARLIREFATVTEGVLATFAVSAIASVRRSAHHLVALFRKELDGAYLAHRCRLPEPDDAKDFVNDLIADELRNVITTGDVAGRCVSADTLEQWVDHVCENNKHVFRNHRAGQDYSVEQVKTFLRIGLSAAKGVLGQKGLKDIESLFFSTRNEAWRRNLEFARLSNLKREREGRSRFPDQWQPVLTLGSILKVLRTRPETKDEQIRFVDLPSDYIVCVQPGCHSVRLKGETSFPFQTAERSDDTFNLVVRDDESEGTELLVGWKPRDAVLIRFHPKPWDNAIRAVREDEGFVFTDTRGRRFLWLGELKDLKAQRSASELAQFIHTAAVDDLEWLRLAAEGSGIDFESRRE